jgi:DNA-binding LacI/PurR family transcriptional regulator
LNKRATIQDVADKAGVSRAAVSKVLRNAYGLSDGMRRKVEAAMGALSYRPQMAARSLRGSSYTLGVLLPDIRNPFFPDILDGITRQLAGTAYQMLLGVRPSVDQTERGLVETMLDRSLDGLIMVAPLLEHHYLKKVAASEPVVIIGRHDHGGGFDTVNNEDAAGAALVVGHFAAMGHKRIGYFGFEEEQAGAANPTVHRLNGFRAAMEKHGLGGEEQIVIASSAHSEAEDRQLALQWLSGSDRPTAILTWTDSVAVTIMSAASELGLRIPQDLSVAGYDNSRVCDLPQLSLTSVDQSAHLLGQKAAELLIERINGREAETHFVTAPALCARRSTGVAQVGVRTD